MDIQFYGANCIALTGKNARIVVDDNLTELGGKSVSKEGDVALFTGVHGEPSHPAKIIVSQPGEYEVSGVSIYGIAARAHIDEEKTMNATMYKLLVEDLSILVTGHIYPELSDDQLEAIGMIDILFVPVGGNGFTLDPMGALKLIKKIEPKLIIPTYYEDPSLSYPVPAQGLEQALKGLAMEPKETVAKLKIKPADLSDVAQLIVVQKS